MSLAPGHPTRLPRPVPGGSTLRVLQFRLMGRPRVRQWRRLRRQGRAEDDAAAAAVRGGCAVGDGSSLPKIV